MADTLLVFPWPPSNNTLYWQAPNVRAGVKTLTQKGREYKQRLLNLYASDDIETLEGPIKITYILIPPTAGDRDLDNFLKAPQDGLKWLGIIKDDSQIKNVRIRIGNKSQIYNRGCIVILIDVLDDLTSYLIKNTEHAESCMDSIKDQWDEISMQNLS